jgi:hypothetical protein
MFTDAQIQIIIEAVKAKAAPEIGKCSVCGHDEWSVQNGFSAVLLTDTPAPFWPYAGQFVAQQSLPSAVLICTTCGNTLLLNLFVLGVYEKLFPPTMPSVAPQGAAAEDSMPRSSEGVPHGEG